MKNPFAVFRLDRKIKLMAAKGKGRFGPRGGPGGSGGRGCSRSPGSAPRLQWRGAPARRRCPPAERRGRSRGPSPERVRGSGECGPQGRGVACRVRARLLDRGSHTWLRHPSAAGSCRPQSGAAGGSWARPRRCPAGPGSEAVPLGSHERAVFCRQDANTPSSAVGSPSPGHSAPGEAFLQPGTAWRVSESLASSCSGWRTGPCRASWLPGHRRGGGLPRKTFWLLNFHHKTC